MKQNGILGLVYNAFFLTFIIAPLAAVMLVSVIILNAVFH